MCEPKSKILAFTSDELVQKQLSLVRGVKSFPVNERININEAIDITIKTLKNYGLVKDGDRLVYVAGIPMQMREAVNTINIKTVH